MNDLKANLMKLVQYDIDQIEVELEKNLSPQLETVEKVASHLLFSGGKRLRPLLMVLSAKLCGYTDTFIYSFSTIFEYLHAATLLHDDLIDGATLRRGKKVAHSIWGNEIAVLVGDYLLSKALLIATQAESIDIIKIIAEITEQMSQGEIHQLINIGRLDQTETEYLQIIERKTAYLFQGACHVSAILSRSDRQKMNALKQYGYQLGVAFQMADDLLDYTFDSKLLGKKVGADLREGKITLPVLHAIGNASHQDRSKMEAIVTNRQFKDTDFDELIKLMDKYNGISYTTNLAKKYVAGAKKALDQFETSESKAALLLIADYSISRKF